MLTNNKQQHSASETPLSPVQERFWILEQLAPGNPVYHVSGAFRLLGALQEGIFRQALSEIVRRHEVLRTRFPAVSGRPSPAVSAPAPFELRVVDVQEFAASQREKEVQQLAFEQARRTFRLDIDLMLRATLVRMGKAEHVLIVTLHRLAADVDSVHILLQELVTIYDTLLANHDSSLPEPPLQYIEFAARQRRWLATDAARKDLSFWKQRLEGMPSLFELPIGRARPGRPTYQSSRHPLKFSPSMAESLVAFAAKEKCDLTTILLGAFEAVIARYSARQDIVLGVVASHRRAQAGAQALIGNFSNTLVLRTKLENELSFSALTSRLVADLTEARAHTEFPFARLVEELNPPRDRSYHPLVQIRFDFGEITSPIPPQGSLQIRLVELDCLVSEFDLTLHLERTASGLEGWLEYATDLMDTDAIARMAGHLETTLKGILENPAQPLHRLPMLTEPERSQLLVEWNDTQISFPQDRCLHELFEEQVERTPEAIAVAFGNEQVSYHELNRRANRVAAQLQELGVGPEVLVGICAARSVEMLAGILGVLKAGGAYVPLDPAYPAERLAFILEDAKTPVLLTQRSLSEGLPDTQAKRLFLDDPALWADSGVPLRPAAARRANSQNLAYVIYTSGSTGRPKGVAIEHHSPVTFVHWAQTVFSRDELAGVLASTSICFDLSVFEIFVPLSVGGKIILAENALQLSQSRFAQEPSLVNTVPSAMAELLRSGGIPASVKVVNLAGEPLETALVRKIYEQTTVRKVYDLYGPSESTVYSTFTLRSSEGAPTIGRPISRTRVYILDEQLQPVPIGVPGELHIGGDGLARGYLNQPALTDEKFVPDPFAQQQGARLYKTGDLARYRPDGNIEFLGRKDHQVKIRGFRIELGEIETVLRKHPGLEAAVVIASEDSRGDKRLVAYVVRKTGERPSFDRPGGEPTESADGISSELRAWLKSKLPEYMLPALFVCLTALPLTPNGKLDRKKLPPPEQLRPDLKEAFVAPRTSTETMLAGVWCEVLGLDEVGVHDNFFDLGGHSLSSIQVISRLRETIQVEVSMGQFFETPTIAALGQVIEGILVQEINELSEEEAQSLAESASVSTID